MSTQVPNLRISVFLWLKLVWKLRKRGKGVRESGAFLLGPASGGRVREFICYDDLDLHCLDSGIIRFDGRGFVPLWKYCSDRKLKVLADVHTHPSAWTGQSEADRTHPMVAQVGHLALILPNFAMKAWSTKGAGVYRYLGKEQWETLPTQSLKVQLFA